MHYNDDDGITCASLSYYVKVPYTRTEGCSVTPTMYTQITLSTNNILSHDHAGCLVAVSTARQEKHGLRWTIR